MTGPGEHHRAAANPAISPLVVLGCRPTWSADGHLMGSLGRRVRAAVDAFDRGGGWLLVTGGRTWGGVVEADAMRDECERLGVARGYIFRERCSLTTRGNARFAAAVLRRASISAVRLVTCDWHMARATALFQRESLTVIPVPAGVPRQGALLRLLRDAREQVSARLWSGTVA